MANIAYVGNVSPFIYAYPFTPGVGFGSKYANPGVAVGGTGYGVRFCGNTDIGAASQNNPYIQIYPWATGVGFGAKYANPGTLPTNYSYDLDFCGKTDVACCCGNSPYVYAYPFTSGVGFGAKYANPGTLPTGGSIGISFGGLADIAIAHGNAPYVTAYPWTPGAGFGAKYANPGVSPGSTGYGARFNGTVDLAIGTFGSPYCVVYPWTPGAGFGVKYANPGTLPGGVVEGIDFTKPVALDITMGAQASPYIVTYPWATGVGFGAKYSNPGTLPGGNGLMSSFGALGDVACAHTASPPLIAYPWQTGVGYGTKYANPAGAPGTQSTDTAFEFPPIETWPATNIQALQATGNGYLLDAANIDELGFEWGVVSGVYTDNVAYTGAMFAGDYSLTMSPLLPSTTYFFRARAHNSVTGWIYGIERSFTTSAAVPVVLTDAPSSVQETSVVGNGTITSTGPDPTCDEVGFVYDLASHGDPGNVAPGASGYAAFVNDAGAFGTGAFSLPITGLTVSKIYYMRAYAHNSHGYAYGEEVFFITNVNVNVLLPGSDYSVGIRFDTSPGGGYPNPYGGTIPHYVLCRSYDAALVAGGYFGYLTGSFAYEKNYYNDNYFTDYFTMTNPTRQEEGIIKFKWKAHPLRNYYPFGKYKRQLITHATQYTGAETICSTSAGLACEVFYANPFTGAPPTLAEMNDIIAGITLGKEGGYGIAACDFLAIYVLWANAAVSADGATNLGGSLRRLFGTVLEDEGETCTVHFEWGATAAYGNVTADQTRAKGDSFTADIDIGALPSIHFRAVIETECGETFYSTDEVFPTVALPAQANIPHRLVDEDMI